MLLLTLLLVPVATAATSFFARRRAAMEAANLAGFGVVFLIAVALAARVLAVGTVSLANGFFYADALSALVVLLTASVALVCSTYSIGYLRDDQQSGALGDDASGVEQMVQLRMYYSLTPLFVFSMLFMAVANNLGVMWAAMEITTLVSVFLVTFYGKVTSLEAAWKYAIIGGRATGQDVDAAGLRPGSHGLWDQGWPRAHAHLEAGRLQRGPGALRRDPFFGAAQLRPLLPHPFLHPY
jgi:hydrogenase-4 component F